MPPTSPDQTTETTETTETTRAATPGTAYQDIDKLKNSDGLVAFFSQRRRDGVITYAIHREYTRFDDATRSMSDSRTSFMTESLAESHLEFMKIVIEHLARLKAQRLEGKLPFPEGGEGALTRQPRRRA